MTIKNKSRRVTRLLLSITLILCLSDLAISESADYCVVCHSELNEDIIKAFESDIHSQVGLSCSDCHGGDPKLEDEDAMDSDFGFVGIPDRKDQPGFCGKCHSDPNYMRKYNPSLPTDQVEKYWTSGHGKVIAAGDQKAAVCVSCHSVHNIKPKVFPGSTVYPFNVPKTCSKCHSDEKYMEGYGLPVDQYAQYTDSLNVHGYALLVKKDIGSPACNDCHGNHGATPPGVESVAYVCTHCHVANGKLFLDSPHAEAYNALEIDACAFCHQKDPDLDEPHRRIHTIVSPSRSLHGVEDDAVCTQCHIEGDEGWEMALEVSQLQDSLDVDMQMAMHKLEDAERRGFEISDAQWMFDNEVKQASMELRTIFHSFDIEAYKPSYEKVDTVLAKVIEAGVLASDELEGRRIYFYVMTVFILVLIITVSLKIRNMEKK